MGAVADVFKAYDIRGTVPDQLDATMCRAIGAAMARFTGAPRILVGRDMRPSGIELAAAFSDGARAAGAAVVDVGLISTDCMFFASGTLDAPGAMFTASHNPAAYNGVKLCLAGARPIGRDTGLVEIGEMTKALMADPPAAGTLPPLEHREILDDFARHARSFVDVGALRPLRVVADTANGMGGLVVPHVMAGLPFDVEVLYG
ncbi:MAG: phosphomannomutase/phosphoglucomutase, partial [Acidimicrobiales bacterium]